MLTYGIAVPILVHCGVSMLQCQEVTPSTVYSHCWNSNSV